MPFYNISTKSTPQGIDPFASLTITYLVAAALSLLMFFVTGEQKNLLTEFSKSQLNLIFIGDFCRSFGIWLYQHLPRRVGK